jgi:hypothetical protein
LDMKITNESEHGNKPCGIKAWYIIIILMEKIWELLQHYKFSKPHSNFLFCYNLWFDSSTSGVCKNMGGPTLCDN